MTSRKEAQNNYNKITVKSIQKCNSRFLLNNRSSSSRLFDTIQFLDLFDQYSSNLVGSVELRIALEIVKR